MPITDYNKKKKLEVSSTNDSGTTQDKAQPILVEGETTFDVSEANFTDSFSVSNQLSSVQSVAFNESGDKMYVVGSNTVSIFEYSLSTNFDVSTASFTDSFDLSGQDPLPKGVVFNDSGSKMFVCGSGGDNVYEYSLSTNFDVSTASFTDSFDVSSQTGGPEGVSFSDSGNKMFVVGSQNGIVYEYSLSTSFDVSTASFTDSFDVSSEDSIPRDISFNNSGNKMFISGQQNGNVYEYSLSKSFDVSSASFTDSFDVSGEDGLPADAAFGDSGNKMFVLGRSNDSVFEYSIGGLESKTGTGDIVIDFTNISDAQDIAVYDQNGNLLDYEIESLDTAAETGVIWAYDSWVRDDSVQAQIAYGDNSANTDRQNVTGTWENETGIIESYNYSQSSGNLVGRTSNSYDQTFTGTQNVSGQYNGAAQGDGVDDIADTDGVNGFGEFTAGNIQVIEFWLDLDTGATNPSGDFEVGLFVFNENSPGFGGTLGSDNTPVIFSSESNNLNKTGTSLQAGTDFHIVVVFDQLNDEIELYIDGELDIKETSPGISDFGTTDNRFRSFGNESNSPRYLDGDIEQVSVYEVTSRSDYSAEKIRASFDASPKAGQVYFSQQAAEATVTDQTVTVPETQTISSNPDPQINATVDVSIPTTTASTVNPAPTVSPGAAPLNLTATTASTANPDFTVQPGNTTVQTPVSTSTVSNPDPQVNPFNEITVPETTAATVNPAPTLTVGQTIITPDTTVTSSNPDLTVQPGESSLNISRTQISVTDPEFGLNRQIVVGVATNLSSENPEPNLQPGLVSVQVPETSILTDNPALQVQPGATRLQIERPTNLETVNPDFNTVSGAAELQVSETQLSASLQEPSIGLKLEFVSPTNALITNDERFFDMPDHTFTEGDLGDTLQAVLKTDASPDGVDLTGATEIRLVVKDRDGAKVFDKEMSIVDSSTGQVEYKWSQGDFIEEPGVYRAKIKVFDSTGEPESFPNDGFRTIEVEEEIS